MIKEDVFLKGNGQTTSYPPCCCCICWFLSFVVGLDLGLDGQAAAVVGVGGEGECWDEPDGPVPGGVGRGVEGGGDCWGCCSCWDSQLGLGPGPWA
jgi:hypothetical protein